MAPACRNRVSFDYTVKKLYFLIVQIDRGLADERTFIHMHVVSFYNLAIDLVTTFIHDPCFIKHRFAMARFAVGSQVRGSGIRDSGVVLTKAGVKAAPRLPAVLLALTPPQLTVEFHKLLLLGMTRIVSCAL